MGRYSTCPKSINCEVPYKAVQQELFVLYDITENIWGSSWDNDVGSLRVFMATLREKTKNLPILRSIFKLMWELDTE